MTYITVPLNADHDRSAFSCGTAAIDNFLKTQASQHMKKSHASVIFVLADEKNKVQAFYSLSNDSIPYSEIPEAIKKIVPRYKNLGVILIGQLAVDKASQNNRLGTHILMDALARCYDAASTVTGAVAVVVDPIDVRAAEWYKKFGFIQLPDQTRLFLPMKTIDDLFSPKSNNV